MSHFVHNLFSCRHLRGTFEPVSRPECAIFILFCLQLSQFSFICHQHLTYLSHICSNVSLIETLLRRISKWFKSPFVYVLTPINREHPLTFRYILELYPEGPLAVCHKQSQPKEIGI